MTDTDLTPRLLDILRGVANGHTNKDIATDLGLSPRTVQGHLKRIFKRLRVTNRSAAVGVACRAGLIRPCDVRPGGPRVDARKDTDR